MKTGNASLSVFAVLAVLFFTHARADSMDGLIDWPLAGSSSVAESSPPADTEADAPYKHLFASGPTQDACAQALIDKTLSQTQFSDVKVTSVSSPWFTNSWSFEATDKAGNDYSGSIQLYTNVVTRIEPISGKIIEKSYVCSKAESCTGPRDLFLLENSKGNIIYNEYNKPITNCMGDDHGSERD